MSTKATLRAIGDAVAGSDAHRAILTAVNVLGYENSFDALVDLRDECQRQIRELQDAEFEQTKRELAELQAKVSEKRARAGNIDKVARAVEPRQRKRKTAELRAASEE